MGATHAELFQMDSYNYMVVSSQMSSKVLYWKSALGIGHEFVEHQTIELKGGTDVEHFEMDGYHWIMISTSDSKNNVGYLKAFELTDDHISVAGDHTVAVVSTVAALGVVASVAAMAVLRLSVAARTSPSYGEVASSSRFRETECTDRNV